MNKIVTGVTPSDLQLNEPLATAVAVMDKEFARETERRNALYDNFRGPNAHLIECMRALILMDVDGKVVPHGIGDHARTLLASAAHRLELGAAPINMVLHCPSCGHQHVDMPEDLHDIEAGCDVRGRSPWNNPPHRSHLCHDCGHIWRPADVPTNGVRAVATTGKNDSPCINSPYATRPAPTVAECIAKLDRWNDALEKAIDRQAQDKLGQHANDEPAAGGRDPLEQFP